MARRETGVSLRQMHDYAREATDQGSGLATAPFLLTIALILGWELARTRSPGTSHP